MRITEIEYSILLDLISIVLAVVFIVCITSDNFQDELQKTRVCYRISMITLIVHMLALLVTAIYGYSGFWSNLIQCLLWIWIANSGHRNLADEVAAKKIAEADTKKEEEINSDNGDI